MARKEKKYHFIYKTTNILSGRYYIGMHSTDNLDDGYLGSGKRLRYSINKYGKENFIREILEFCKTREELKNKESEIINLNEIAKIDCINLKVGGEGGFSSEEHKIKFVTHGVKNGRKKTDEYLNSKFGGDDNWLSSFNSHVNKTAWKNEEYRNNKLKNLDWTGKKHTEESKRLISEKRKGTGLGENNSQYGTCWITKDDINKKIKKEDFNTYLNEGWIKGRVKKIK